MFELSAFVVAVVTKMISYCELPAGKLDGGIKSALA